MTTQTKTPIRKLSFAAAKSGDKKGKTAYPIDGDKLPVGREQELLDELQTLFASYKATDAITVESSVKPVADFHVRRHTLLTPEQNITFQEVCPFVAMVKSKGRK